MRKKRRRSQQKRKLVSTCILTELAAMNSMIFFGGQIEHYSMFNTILYMSSVCAYIIEPVKKQVTVVVIKPDAVSAGKVDSIIEKVRSHVHKHILEVHTNFYTTVPTTEHFLLKCLMVLSST